MKKYISALFILSFLVLSTPVQALHDGGVGPCEACHTMHNSLNNLEATSGMVQFSTGPALLRGSDPSSVCLNCHQGDTISEFWVSTGGITSSPGSIIPAQRSPGGDFSWLKYGTTDNFASLRGHNIIAADYGYIAEPRAGMVTSPGGNFPSERFYCSSCHDPHGQYRVNVDGTVATTGLPIAYSGSYGTGPSAFDPTADYAVGSYRLLAVQGYLPSSAEDASTVFLYSVPATLAPSVYNRSEAVTQTRIAYGSGMSEWCANCHASIHNDDYPSHLRHPAGDHAKLTGTIVSNYNSYVKTGDMTGEQMTSYLSLVPFEAGLSHADRATMKALVDTSLGPDTTANVMCLSCHRAHASSFDSMLRWDGTTTFIVFAGVYAKEGWTQGALTAAYYDRPPSTFAVFQKSLCNKCHAMD